MFIFHILTNINFEKVARSTAEAFTTLYETYLPKIFSFMSYRVSDGALAEDLTAAVFEKALVKFSQYRAEKGATSTWLFRIARNTLIDHFRQKSREVTVPLDETMAIPDRSRTPEETAIAREQSRQLHTCLSRLSTPEQDIITLKFSSGMNNRQIADLLDLTESNVGVILYRAVRKLRTCFEGWRDG